jgi:hypothetical protein
MDSSVIVSNILTILTRTLAVPPAKYQFGLGRRRASDAALAQKVSEDHKGNVSKDDPGAYSKPWTFTTHPTMLNGELIEYICQENNRDVQHLVGK